MRYAIMVLSVALLALLVIEFNSRMTELNNLTVEYEVINQQLLEKLERPVFLSTSAISQ